MGLHDFTGDTFPMDESGIPKDAIPMIGVPVPVDTGCSMDDSSSINELLINYNEKNRNSDPILFRENIVSQTLGILITKNKPNAMLVGPAGTGKTKIVEEIARLLSTNSAVIPDVLKENTIYELPISNIVCGYKRGSPPKVMTVLISYSEAIFITAFAANSAFMLSVQL